nr:MAG TPA: DNA polymerase [Caudoviricetes sp.]
MKSSIVNKRHIHLIETEEDYQLLKSLIENPYNKTIGYDTETTGLDYIHDHIVGFCFGVGSPIEGYYIPVRHVIGNNFPVEYGLDLIRYCLESKKTLLMCNKVFDITMTEKEGVYFPFNAKIMDVQIMAHLVTQEKFPSLKKSVSKYLKYKVVEFSEAAKNSEEEKNYNAGDTNPEQFYLYAAADPVYTVDLGRFLWKEYPYIRKIFPIDNIAAEAVRRISKNIIHLDYSVIRKELEHEEALLREDKLRCFQIAGYEFNPASNRQKGEALSRFVVLTKKTKSGKDFQVNDEILEGIDHPLAEALVSFSKRRKYISSYLTPLLATEGTPVRIHYGMVAAPCLTKDSNVYIQGKGLISIADVREGDYIQTRFGFKKVTMAEKHWSEKTVNVKLRGGLGSFTSTPWHPVLRVYGNKAKWYRVDNLRKNFMISGLDNHFYDSYRLMTPEIVQSPKKKIIVPSEASAYLCQLIGMIDGDGSLCPDRLKLCFNQYEPEVESYYTVLFDSLFKLPLTREVGKDHTIQRTHCSVALVRWFKSMGVKGDCSWIKKISMTFYPYYLAGLWDSDGCLNSTKGNYSPRLKMTNKDVVLTAARFLMALGIDINFTKCNSYENTQYQVECRGVQGRTKFAELVAPLMASNKKKHRAFINKREAKLNLKRVLSIKESEGDYVYHLEVEDVHEYIADGIVHHNTGRMASGTYRGNSFYSPLNVMSIPKVSKKRYIHPDPVLGYILNDNPEGAIGQQKTKAGLRDAFVAPEGYVVVTADFCLDPNVLVQTRTGLKEMRLLKNGEEVLTPKGFKKCINPHYTGNHQVYKLVTSYYELRCSGEHKVAVMMSDRYVWKEVKNLRPDELVFIINSNGEKEFTPFIVQKTDEVIEMMDMTVEDVHCFYANGILVHNCGEELRIVTNMSGERVFADAILNGKDLHMETAKTMFGVASEEQRDHVKTINFASLYGANEYTLSKKLKIPVESARHMLDIYKKSLSALTRWKEWIVKQGKKTGFVFTYYGRPRAVYPYFKSSDRSMQGFAERTCYNSPIQGCIPSSTFIPLSDSVVRLSSVLGQKCLFSDGKYGIVSGRGSSTILYDVFTKSGDFCRVDSNHKLITKFNGEYRTILVQDVYKKSICLSPLRWRLFNPLKFLTVKRPKKHILVQSQHTKVMRTPKLVASFWRCYLSHSKFRIEHKRALDVRALADLCGFNLKYKGSYYVLSLKRPKKSKVVTIIPRVENVPIASATMDGIQIYPAQGFLNKNTGADVMRILLTKLQNEVETNPEFRENVIIGWPVHDEVNSYVKLNYIHDYFYKIKEFMTIKHDNWIVPLEAEIGIGYSWGTCFDVTEVTKDNKLVLPDKYKTENK